MKVKGGHDVVNGTFVALLQGTTKTGQIKKASTQIRLICLLHSAQVSGGWFFATINNVVCLPGDPDPELHTLLTKLKTYSLPKVDTAWKRASRNAIPSDKPAVPAVGTSDKAHGKRPVAASKPAPKRAKGCAKESEDESEDEREDEREDESEEDEDEDDDRDE